MTGVKSSLSTLEAIKEIISGLPASLVGAGVLEEDEDDALLAEIEASIKNYGTDYSGRRVFTLRIIIYLYSFLL